MAYQQMASLYDQLMNDAPYDQWINFTEEMIKNSGKEVKQILDLGCGTGEITTRLSAKGYQIIGVDYSSDMLTYAEAKASSQNQSIRWVQQDIRELVGFKDVDVAISYCDVINYITTESDLKQTFKSVADSLKPSGLFIFDVHSFRYIEEGLLNQVFTEVTDDVCYIWDCQPGPEKGEMFHDITFFSSDGMDKYDRFEESHHQRAFSVDVYTRLLSESGFEKPILYGDFSTEKAFSVENIDRMFFVAKKRSR